MLIYNDENIKKINSIKGTSKLIRRNLSLVNKNFLKSLGFKIIKKEGAYKI